MMATSSHWNESSLLSESNIAMNLYSNPIAYKIVGKILTKEYLLIQISAVIFSVVIAGFQFIFKTYIT
jgi:hypothetical protein